MALLKNECSLCCEDNHMCGDTQTLLAVLKKIKLVILSGDGDTKTLAVSPHAQMCQLMEFPLANIFIKTHF